MYQKVEESPQEELLNIVADLMEIKPDTLKFFDVEDPFNPGNTLQGLISSQRDSRFGSLAITGVNGRRTDIQLVYCTPKLKYPFNAQPDGTRIYKWPDNTGRMVAYEKLDGTNVLAYSYTDAEGKRFVTFKTRLTPVCQESEFGPFQSMWKQVLSEHPEIQTNPLVLSGDYTLSFELYGAANPILVNYDFHLKATFLFAIRQVDQKVFPHIHMPSSSRSSIDELPTRVVDLPKYCIDDSPLDDIIPEERPLEHHYDLLRTMAEDKNQPTDDGMIDGIEGYVMYVEDLDGHWHMFKCKPPSVEEVHWRGGTIPLAIVVTEIWKVLETTELEELTKEAVVERLQEEFTQQEIISSHKRIDKAIRAVVEKALMMRKMRKAFEKMPDEIRESKDKATIMRYLSPQFEKRQMRKVYTALAMQGLV